MIPVVLPEISAILNTPTVTKRSFPVTDLQQTKIQVLNWANRFSTFCLLDNHAYQTMPHSEECLVAAGAERFISADGKEALNKLQAFIDVKESWLFGHLAYDLTSETASLSSHLPDKIGFPDLCFFEPSVLIRLNKTQIVIEANDPAEVFSAITRTGAADTPSTSPVIIQNKISKKEYCTIIDKLKQHILRGDCYEINFCQEFFAVDAVINPVAVYKRLSAVSPNPFSALYKLEDKWLICASPERFLNKQGHHILSQPIKGTSKRIHGNKQMDEANKDQLKHSAKDRSENVMVVDLVRNDLSKICKEGTVKTDELYGIYSFPQVHQMISTIRGELEGNISFTDIIKATFLMGSMTGAPKKRVIELIGQHEKTKRGIFSGAFGYVTPAGDFDFNVVIRSIMYNESSRYLSFQAGSGITFYSDAEKEWEECLWKAEAMKSVLNQL